MMLRSPKNSGFILVTTIWFLAIASLAASAFAIWTSRSLNLVAENSNATAALLDIHSTQATLLYLLGTQRLNSAGVITQATNSSSSANTNLFLEIDGPGLPIDGSEIMIDGRSYRGLGLAHFSIKDESGYININSNNGNQLKQMLKNVGVSERTSDGLFDKLQDYIDKDSLHRLDGAEAFHYEKAGMALPSNKPLTSPHELYNVMDWKKILDKNPEILLNLSVTPHSLINFNAASAAVIHSLTDSLNLDMVKTIIEERNQRPFQSLTEASQRTKLYLSSLFEKVLTSPSQTFRISLWYNQAKIEQQITLKITPNSSLGKPWKYKSSARYLLSEEHKSALINDVQSELFKDSDVADFR